MVHGEIHMGICTSTYDGITYIYGPDDPIASNRCKWVEMGRNGVFGGMDPM